MLLTIDVGNTSIGAAVFSENTIIFKNKLTTPDQITKSFLLSLIPESFTEGIDAIIVSSVVPFIDSSLSSMAKTRFNKSPLFVDHRTKTDIKIKIDNPEELGADRIADAVGGLLFSDPPMMILDSGTATTFDIINKKYEYIGGSIFPGIELSIRSLASNTAKLKRIHFSLPESILGSNTEDNIRAGICYSYIGGLNYMIGEYKKIIGQNAKVIATGGVSLYFQSKIKGIDIFEPDLIYYGLKKIHEKQ